MERLLPLALAVTFDVLTGAVAVVGACERENRAQVTSPTAPSACRPRGTTRARSMGPMASRPLRRRVRMYVCVVWMCVCIFLSLSRALSLTPSISDSLSLPPFVYVQAAYMGLCTKNAYTGGPRVAPPRRQVSDTCPNHVWIGVRAGSFASIAPTNEPAKVYAHSAGCGGQRGTAATEYSATELQ